MSCFGKVSQERLQEIAQSLLSAQQSANSIVSISKALIPLVEKDSEEYKSLDTIAIYNRSSADRLNDIYSSIAKEAFQDES